DSNETGHYIWELRQAGVYRLFTYERWYDFRREEDRAIFNLVQDFTNNKYLRDHALRVLRGKKDNAQAGYSNGGGLAYATERLLVKERNEPVRRVRKGEKIEKPKNWRYVRVPAADPERQQEVDTVKWLFHEFAYNDVSARGLARQLNERGVLGP